MSFPQWMLDLKGLSDAERRIFVKEEIDEEIFPEFTDEEFVSIGIAPGVHLRAKDPPQGNAWLQALALTDEHRQKFIQAGVNEAQFWRMDDSSLKSLGIPAGPRKRLTKILNTNAWLEVLPLADEHRSSVRQAGLDEAAFLSLDYKGLEALGIRAGPRNRLAKFLKERNQALVLENLADEIQKRRDVEAQEASALDVMSLHFIAKRDHLIEYERKESALLQEYEDTLQNDMELERLLDKAENAVLKWKSECSQVEKLKDERKIDLLVNRVAQHEVLLFSSTISFDELSPTVTDIPLTASVTSENQVTDFTDTSTNSADTATTATTTDTEGDGSSVVDGPPSVRTSGPGVLSFTMVVASEKSSNSNSSATSSAGD